MITPTNSQEVSSAPSSKSSYLRAHIRQSLQKILVCDTKVPIIIGTIIVINTVFYHIIGTTDEKIFWTLGSIGWFSGIGLYKAINRYDVM